MSSVDVLDFLPVYCTFQRSFVQHESDGLQLTIKIKILCVPKNWSNLEIETNKVTSEAPTQGQVGWRMVLSHSAITQRYHTVLSHSTIAQN